MLCVVMGVLPTCQQQGEPASERLENTTTQVVSDAQPTPRPEEHSVTVPRKADVRPDTAPPAIDPAAFFGALNGTYTTHGWLSSFNEVTITLKDESWTLSFIKDEQGRLAILDVLDDTTFRLGLDFKGESEILKASVFDDGSVLLERGPGHVLLSRDEDSPAEGVRQHQDVESALQGLWTSLSGFPEIEVHVDQSKVRLRSSFEDPRSGTLKVLGRHGSSALVSLHEALTLDFMTDEVLVELEDETHITVESIDRNRHRIWRLERQSSTASVELPTQEKKAIDEVLARLEGDYTFRAQGRVFQATVTPGGRFSFAEEDGPRSWKGRLDKTTLFPADRLDGRYYVLADMGSASLYLFDDGSAFLRHSSRAKIPKNYFARRKAPSTLTDEKKEHRLELHQQFQGTWKVHTYTLEVGADTFQLKGTKIPAPEGTYTIEASGPNTLAIEIQTTDAGSHDLLVLFTDKDRLKLALSSIPKSFEFKRVEAP